MSYPPTTWVEKATKVGPTNLNKLELGLQAAALAADNALPTPAGTNGQFLKKVGGVWVPTSFAASDIPNYPADATKFLKGDGTWASPAYTAFTPTWAATGTQPVLGNGALSGRFVQIGKLVHFYIHLSPGSTTTFGTGSYTFTLPVTGASVPGSPLGPAYALDSSASAFAYAAAIYATTATFNVQQPAAWPTGIANSFGQTAPWTWATSDTLDINGTYEAA